MDPLPAIVLPTTPAPSLGERVIGTFVAPGTLGEKLRDHPRWVAPALLAFFISAPAFLSMYVTERGWAMVKAEVERQGLPPEQMEMFLKFRWGYAAGSAVCPVVMEAAVISAGAGICLLIFTYGMGREGRYVHYVSVISHVMLIMSVGTVLTLILQLSSGNLQATPSLAPLLKGRPTNDPAVMALGAVNFFALWVIVACGTMIGGLTRKGSGAPIVTLGAIYAVINAFFIGVAWYFQRGGAA